MNVRHVLLTTDVVGGVWDFSVVLAHELLRRDLCSRLTLLALGDPSREQWQQAVDAGADLIAEPLKLEWMRDADDDVRRTRELIHRLLRQLRPDLVHANQFATACADVDVPVVLTVHSDVLSWRRWAIGVDGIAPEWRAYTALVRAALERADAVVAVSAFLAGEVDSIYRSDRRIEVIHNGWPASKPDDGTARGRDTLLAGRVWDFGKNISLAAQASAGWDPGNVYLAGAQVDPDSGEHAHIPAPIQPLGFLPQHELDAWFRRARIYLSPARYDPFGLLPLQAAQRGCALLLSDIPSYRELWEGAACFFSADDASDLRRQWSLLLDDPDAARDLGRKATRRAEQRYAVGAMAAAYAALYVWVVAASPMPA
jgi:glycosyltransferase involved in cell wall biosynthesis